MLKPKPKILSFILIAIMLAAALGGLCLATDTAEAAPIEFSSSALPASGTLMQASSTWAATRDASTGSVLSQTVYMAQASIQAGYDPIIARSLFWFDLSVSNSFTLNGVSLSLTPRGVWDSVGSTKLLFLIPSGSVGTTLDGNDYSRTLYTGGVACEIPLSSLTDGVTSSFALTAAGKSYINSIQDRSAVPLYMVVSSDYHNSPPPAGGNVGADFEGYSTVKLVYNFEAPTTYVWDGGGSTNLASDRYNWDKNIAPQPGSDVRYDATSVKACTWDLATEVYSFAIATGYTGTVIQGDVDIRVGEGGYYQHDGALTTTKDKKIISDGDFIQSGGSISLERKLNIVMNGDNTTLSILHNDLASITINGDVTFKRISGQPTVAKLTVSEGSVFTLTHQLNIYGGYESGTIPELYNDGTIEGSKLLIGLRRANTTMNFGNVNSPVQILLFNSADSSKILYLGSDTTIPKEFSVNSEHSEYQCVVDLNGHSLTAASVTVGTRGGLTNTGAAALCAVSGAFTLSGTDASVSGPIALDCYSFTISDGTYTQGNVDISIGAGGYLQQAGTFVGKPTRNVVCAGQFVKIGGSLNSLNITFTGVASSFTTNTGEDVIYKIRNENSLTIKSGCYVNNIENLGSMVLPTGTFLRYAPTSVGCTFSNAGTITGDGTLNIWIYNHDPGIAFGDISSRVSIRTSYVPTNNPIVTMQGDGTTGPLTILSQHATYAITLDLNGHSLTAASVTVGTRGNILWGEGTHRIGSLDTSAGSSDFETSQVIMEQSGIISLGPGQSFYDLTVAKDVTATLGSDVEVTHYAVLYGSVVRGDYILTLAHIINSYPPLTLDKFDNYLYRINVVPGAQLTMLEYPSWLTWNPHQLTLSGKAVQAGTFNVRIMAEFPGGQQEYQNYTVTVSGLPPTPGWSGGQPLTDYGSIMIYIVVGAAIAFILLVFAFMRRR